MRLIASRYSTATFARKKGSKDKKKRNKIIRNAAISLGLGALSVPFINAGVAKLTRRGMGRKFPLVNGSYSKVGSELSNSRTVVGSRPKLISSSSSANRGNRVEQGESASLVTNRKGIIKEKRTSNTHNRRYNATLPKVPKTKK